MRVAVVYVLRDPEDPEKVDFAEQAAAMARFLSEAGHNASPRGVDGAIQLIEFLERDQPDFVFNLCSAKLGRNKLHMGITAIYDLFATLYVGSSALTLGLTSNKGISKALFRAGGVPTPRGTIVDDFNKLNVVDGLKPPWIVKPLTGGGSSGIDRGSVVYDDSGLRARVEFVLEKWRQPALVEEFIEGREFTVALLAQSSSEFTTLPIVEILFDNFPERSPHIFSYAAKWSSESLEYCATSSKCPADLDSGLEENIRRAVLSAAQVVDLKDYGRIDVRVRRDDNAVFVIDVNASPDIGADSDFVLAAKASGRTYAQVVCQVLQCAIDRYDGL
ncbi:MAG TPA: ATP-grasp domain-containing protein [Terriglobia bacterium]|nr:ATP-grasp domain-containing protein [Terriglobia bacterium]